MRAWDRRDRSVFVAPLVACTLVPVRRRYAIRLFLGSLATWKPGEIEPDVVQEDRREWAKTVVGLIGEDCPDDLEMMTLQSLAHATLALCDDPRDADAIAWFEDAGRNLLEIIQLSS
jgi:hypothetical protein